MLVTPMHISVANVNDARFGDVETMQAAAMRLRPTGAQSHLSNEPYNPFQFHGCFAC